MVRGCPAAMKHANTLVVIRFVSWRKSNRGTALGLAIVSKILQTSWRCRERRAATSEWGTVCSPSTAPLAGVIGKDSAGSRHLSGLIDSFARACSSQSEMFPARTNCRNQNITREYGKGMDGRASPKGLPPEEYRDPRLPPAADT